MTDLDIAKEAYEIWDMYGGKALGFWEQQYCQEAWLKVVDRVRELVDERDDLLDGDQATT